MKTWLYRTSRSKLFSPDTQHKEWIMLGLTSKIKSLDFSMQHEEMGCTKTGRYGKNSIPYEIYLDTGHQTIRHWHRYEQGITNIHTTSIHRLIGSYHKHKTYIQEIRIKLSLMVYYWVTSFNNHIHNYTQKKGVK